MRGVLGHRHVRVAVCIALLLSGCAVDPPVTSVRTKIVKEYIKESPPPRAYASCKEPFRRTTCAQMASCAEAVHYFKCGVEGLVLLCHKLRRERPFVFV